MHLKLSHYFFKTFGLAPLKIQPKPATKTSNRHHFAPTIGSAIYNVLFTTLLISLNYYCINTYEKDVQENFNTLKLDRAFSRAHSVHTVVVASLIPLIFCIYGEKLASIANEMLNLYERVSMSDVGASSMRNDLKRACVVNALIVLFVLVSTPPYTSVVLYQLGFYPCILLINLVYVQYAFTLSHLRRLYARLNQEFPAILKSENVDVIAQHQESISCEKISKTSGLLRLRNLYMDLNDLSHEISEFYSPTMLLCTSYVFHTVLLAAYYLIRPVVIEKIGVMRIGYLHCFALFLQYAFLLATLTIFVAAVVQESRKTGDILGKCFVNSQQLYNVVNQFSIYLLHKSVRFNVYGLFSLDQSLVAGSIVTYLVIMLQFSN